MTHASPILPSARSTCSMGGSCSTRQPSRSVRGPPWRPRSSGLRRRRPRCRPPDPRRRADMALVEALRTAFIATAANKLRAALTIRGILVGVAAVIGMVSVGEGAQASINSTLQGLGTNLVLVSPGGVSSGLVRGAGGGATTLTLDDVSALQAAGALPDAAASEPEMTGRGQAIVCGSNTNTSITGTTPAFLAVRNWTIATGA